MGNGGKYEERQRARGLRAESWTLQEIADELRVAKGSVSVWVRDVEFTPKPRNRGHTSQKPHPLHLRKLAEIERCRAEAQAVIGSLSGRDRQLFALGLYAGEGAKTHDAVAMANTNPKYLRLFLAWLRDEFVLDETRLRARLYLHEGLCLETAVAFWSEVLDIPPTQFQKPYRAQADATRRRAKHERGCATVIYQCSLTHRRVMAMIEAVTSTFAIPG